MELRYDQDIALAKLQQVTTDVVVVDIHKSRHALKNVQVKQNFAYFLSSK